MRPLDTLIAGQALARDLTLVTHNTREFRPRAWAAYRRPGGMKLSRTLLAALLFGYTRSCSSPSSCSS